MMTLIFGKKLTVDPYNCFPLNVRMSVLQTTFNMLTTKGLQQEVSGTSGDSSQSSQTYLYNNCNDTTETRIKVWRKKIKSGPVKLCDIPPTKEAIAENIKRAHYQVVQWRAAVRGVPQKMEPTFFRYEAQPKQIKDLF